MKGTQYHTRRSCCPVLAIDQPTPWHVGGILQHLQHWNQSHTHKQPGTTPNLCNRWVSRSRACYLELTCTTDVARRYAISLSQSCNMWHRMHCRTFGGGGAFQRMSSARNVLRKPASHIITYVTVSCFVVGAK